MQASASYVKKFNQGPNSQSAKLFEKKIDSKAVKFCDLKSQRFNQNELLGKVQSKHLKSQSAMEYLMTYGWAILIIAVVLVALFQMGVFNSANFAPKAQAGSSLVFKTTISTTLEGTCNNELPQYVAQFGNSIITTGTTGLPLGTNPRSIFAWIYYTGNGGYQTVYGYGGTTTGSSSVLMVHNYEVYFGGNYDDYQSTLKIPQNAWAFVGFTYAGGNTITTYLNQQTPTSGNTPSALYTSLSGTDPSNIGYTVFYGSIANVQVYNTSLSANDINALYKEGIGGAPIKVNNLVAWWPLNGNANDYSGNNNNGAATNIIYSGSWASTYSAP